MQPSIQIEKAFIALMGCLAFMMLCGLSLNAQSGPKLFLASRAYNLDTIPCDTTLYDTIPLKNVGDAPIKLLYIKNSGGCAYADINEKPPLLPGESRNVRIAINSHKRSGNQRKSFVIHSDDATEPAIVVQYSFVIRCEKED